ncbi:MAG: tRNA (adenosine(37)-N6)-threonylcarbamoyltransferase complex ATPase subunit type 1 TsaE [Clostridia bacterium]|nr:tRNA (adenosine(37)-N6)-threonylcarbamoyltransferase complex ATPase subunit type 1 TsaE [Clostridia bacterium]
MKRGSILQKFITNSPEETEAVAERLAAVLGGTEIIAMFGGLGAGKTAFTRGLARGLGINDGVSSPTFALVHEYSGKFPVYHFDMYRVTSWDDLYTTGFFDYMDNGIMVIEWSENIEAFLPEEHITVTIKSLSDNEREITIEGAKKI